MITCTVFGENHSLDVVYQEYTGVPTTLGGDTYFIDVLNLEKYNDVHQMFNVIKDYVYRNNGTCEIEDINF